MRGQSELLQGHGCGMGGMACLSGVGGQVVKAGAAAAEMSSVPP